MQGILISRRYLATVPKDRDCCWHPLVWTAPKQTPTTQKAPTKILLPVWHACFLLNKLFPCKNISLRLHQSAFYNTAILLFACFSQLEIKHVASLLAAPCLGFFQSLYKKQSKTATLKFFKFTSRNVPCSTFSGGQWSHLGSVLSKTGQSHFIKVNWQ